MRVAIAWNHPSRLVDCSFRFEQYLRGFRALGHEPVLVCHRGMAEGFPEPAESCEPAAFEEPETWHRLGAQVAVIVTWHRMPKVLVAMQRAGLRVVAISDSDGQVGVRAHPWTSFERMWVVHHGLIDKLRGSKYWLERFFDRDPAEVREVLESTRHSDVVVLGHEEGRRHFRHFLARQGAGELDRRVTVVPFTIGASFLACPLPDGKDDRVAAIGRWGDPQKNADLLAATIARVVAARPATEWVLFGSGGAPWFRDLAERHPQVKHRGEAEQAEVAQTLATCRSIVFSSRWEGSPHAAIEALACGATVVGTPIPSLVSWTENRAFGQVAAAASPRSLARAVVDEMRLWDDGGRDHAALAAEWRSRAGPENVCRRFLEGVDGVNRGEKP